MNLLPKKIITIDFAEAEKRVLIESDQAAKKRQASKIASFQDRYSNFPNGGRIGSNKINVSEELKTKLKKIVENLQYDNVLDEYLIAKDEVDIFLDSIVRTIEEE